MRYRKKLVKNNFRRSFLDNVYSKSDISSKIEEATLEITDNPIEVDLKTFQNNSSSTASITSYDSLLYPETSTRQNLLNINIFFLPFRSFHTIYFSLILEVTCG